MDRLSDRPRIGNMIPTSCSPSSRSHDLLWPDGHADSVPIRGENPTIVKRGDYECRIYVRGSAKWEEIQERVQAALAQKSEELASLERRMEALRNSTLAEVLDEVDFEAGARDTAVNICTKSAPHHDCDVCPDDETGNPPRHFSTSAALRGHMGSSMHKELAGAETAAV